MNKSSKLFSTCLLILFFSAFGINAYGQKVSEGQRMALYTKPSVVRILDGYVGTAYWPNNGKLYTVSYVGSGSGAIIDANGYIATNAHVTDLTHQGEDKGKELLFIEFVKQLAADYGRNPREILNSASALYQIRNRFEPRDFRHLHHVILPDGSVFPFEIKAFGAPVGEGKDVSIIKIEIKNAPVLKVGESDKVQLQDHVTVYGYPAAADTAVLDQKSQLEASITDGKVSAKKNSSDGAPILQISAPATHGNSGGPVLNDKGEIVGLLTFRGDTVNGQEVQGFNFVVSSSTVLEFVKQAGATANKESAVDKEYRAGLELYWDGKYTAAMKKFETVRSLFAQHSEADHLIRDSQQAIAEGKEKSGGLGLVIGGLLMLMLMGGGAFLFLKMKRSNAQASFAPTTNFAPTASFAPTPLPQTAQPQPPFQPAPQPSFNGQPAYQPAGQMPAPPPLARTTKTTMVLSAPLKSATAQIGFGTITWTTGQLAGQQMAIKPEGLTIGREADMADVVIADGRISGRHLWLGVRNGRVVVVDHGSRNGTFINHIEAGRIQEKELTAGDTVIFSEEDAARFIYQK